MKPVANLVIEMAANVARLEKDMATARRSVDGAMQKIQKSAQMAMRALGALGLGLGAAQMVGFVKQAIATGDRMQKLSQQIGVATENIAGLEMAFRQGGASSSDLEMAMARLNLGVSTQTKAYKQLNIQSKDTFGALLEIADLVQTMPDGLEKSALANELFGRSGARLIPTLNQGSDGLRRYIELSQQLGTAVTPEVAKQFELYNDTMDDVGEAMRGLAMQAATALIPTLQSLAESLRNLFADGAVQRGIEGMIEAFKLLGIVIAGRLISSIAAMTAGMIGFAASMTAGTTAVGGFTVAVTGLKGLMAMMGGPVGLIATAAGALIYFTEKAYQAETTAKGLAEKLGMTNAELIGMTKIQVEQKIIDVALELQKLEVAAIEAAAAQALLNEQMSDPEAYSFAGGQISSELGTINKKIGAFSELLETLKQRLVSSQKASTDTGNSFSNTGKSAEEAEDKVRDLIRAYTDETYMMTMSNREREHFLFLNKMEAEGIQGNTKLWHQLADAYKEAQVARTSTEAAIAQQEKDKERLEKRIEQEKEFADEAQRINDQIGQSLTDALMNGGMNAKDYLINMFKTLVLRPILQPIISGTLGAFGLGTAGAAMAGIPGGEMMGGGTDAFGLVSALKSGYDVLSGGFTAVGTAAAEFAASMQYGTSMFSQQTAMLAAQEAGMATTVGTIGAAATVLAGVAAGVAAGSFISGQYSVLGDPMVATGIGTAAGLAIAAAAGFGPVGLAVGALLGGAGGGLINRAFGKGPKETQAAGVTGTLSPMGTDLQAFEQWSQKGGWFSSGSKGTDIRALDSDLTAYFDQQAMMIGGSVAILAEQLGQSSERIGEYSEQIRVDLLNLSDEDAQARIAETFERFSDNLTNFLVPSVQFMTKEGESSSEALTRLATSLVNVNLVFNTMGIDLLDLSLNASQAASNLIDLVGGLDEFTQKSDFFYQNFYSQQERVDTLVGQTTAAFEQMGIALPSTRDGFRQIFEVVAGSGSASMTAALLNLAPVMNDIITYTEQLDEAERQLAETIKNERLGLEREILTILGDTVELRERELSALDESNRVLQEQIYLMDDLESSLADAVSATDDAFSKLQDSLANELNQTLIDLESNFTALTNSLNAQVTAAEASRDVANENLTTLTSIFSLLDNEINRLMQGTMVAQSAAQGSAFIAQALASAQATGYLPDRESLATAVTAARGGLGSEQFGSSFEQRRASLQLTNSLVQLRDITGDQKSVTERQLDVAEMQLLALYERLDQASAQYAADQDAAQADFERQLEAAQVQIDALRNIDDSVFSVEQAITLLSSAIEAERDQATTLQKQMIALQQDANARQQAELERQEAERVAQEKRIAEEAAAAEAARQRAIERAQQEVADAEAARVARAKAEAEAAARAAAEEAARLAAEAARRQGIIDLLTGGNPLFGGSGNNPYNGGGGESDNNFGYYSGPIGGNADGGHWAGGLSLVGEEGPELVNFARPSMIYTAGETAEILNGGAKNAEASSEVRQLRAENQAQSRAMVALQARMTRLLERWDGDGLPQARYEEATA